MEYEKLGLRNWESDQRKIIDDVDAILDKAVKEASAKLSSVSGFDELGFASCLECSCEFFVPRSPDIIPGAEAPGFACMRTGCRHTFLKHKVI